MTTARSQQRYLDWLAARRETGQSFGEWLKAGAENQETERDDECWTCRGTGLGQYDGAGCAHCNGRGFRIPKPEYDYD